MGLRPPAEVVSFHPTLEAFAFAGADDVDPVADVENVDRHLITGLHLRRSADPEFAQESQRGKLVALQVSQLTAGEALRFDLTETQLDSRVTVAVDLADLGDKARPSFNERHRQNLPGVVKDLGHADFPANKPLHRLSPAQVTCGTVSQGQAASSPIAGQLAGAVRSTLVSVRPEAGSSPALSAVSSQRTAVSS